MDTRNTRKVRNEQNRLSYHRRMRDQTYRDSMNERRSRDRENASFDKILLQEENQRLRELNERYRRRIIQLESYFEDSDSSFTEAESIDTETEEEESRTENIDFDEDDYFTESYRNVVKERLEDDSRYFKKVVGMTKEDFDRLYTQCQPLFHRYTQSGHIRQQLYAEGKYLDIDQLFITLYWMRSGDIFFKKQIIFGIHERTIRRICYRTTRVLYDALKDEMVWPSDNVFEEYIIKFEKMRFPEFPNAVCSVDGSEFKIPRKHRDGFYSQKKKQYSLNALFIVNLQGKFLYNSSMVPGAHDQREWNHFNLRERFVGKTYGILGDSGFTFNRRGEQNIIQGYVPVKRLPNASLSEESINYNTKLSKTRVVVENSIGQLKKWGVLSGKLRMCTNNNRNIEFYNMVLINIVVLTNRQMDIKPLRPDNWEININL